MSLFSKILGCIWVFTPFVWGYGILVSNQQIFVAGLILFNIPPIINLIRQSLKN